MRFWNPWWMVIALAACAIAALVSGGTPTAWLFGGLALLALVGWRQRAASRDSPWHNGELLPRRRPRPAASRPGRPASAHNGHHA